MKVVRLLLGVMVAVLIAGPTSAADVPPDGSCLVERWADVPPTPSGRAYDIEHDYRGANNPGFISCDGFTTPSAIQNSLSNIQRALRENDVALLKQEFSFPLVINGAESRQVNANEFARRYRMIFTPEIANFVQTLTISDVMVAGYRGAALGHGFMWFRWDRAAPFRPKVAAINLSAAAK